MKFKYYRKFFITRFSESGISFGIHFSQTMQRIDIHLWRNVYSIGKVPIYENQTSKKLLAVSDYYHHQTIENKKRSLLGI